MLGPFRMQACSTCVHLNFAALTSRSSCASSSSVTKSGTYASVGRAPTAKASRASVFLCQAMCASSSQRPLPN